MKKFFFIAGLALAGLSLTSCSSVYSPAGAGLLYTDVVSPAHIVDNARLGTKVGRSSATSVLGLVATGDAGVNEAAKQGGITKISHVDVQQKSILGLFGTYEVIVYGE